MKNVTANAPYWIAGTLAGFVGIVAARLVAPHLEHTPRLVCTAGGQLLALSGLAIICIGVNRRVKRDAAALSSDSSPSS